MAEGQSFGRSVYWASDQVPDHYCEPCYEVHDEIKPVAGHCQNCNENLCFVCYTRHLRRQAFQSHTLVDKTPRPKTKSISQVKPKKLGEKCLLHHGETIQSFCHHHFQLCCKVCLSIDHQGCKTEKISKLARNIQDCQELQNLMKKLNTLKKGFKDSLSKAGVNAIVVQRNHTDAINEMKKLQDEFDKLMKETKSQAEKVKEEDFNKIEKVAATCDIVIEQINKLTTNLDRLQKQGKNEGLFISMKRAENQIKSLEGNLEKIAKENAVRDYKFHSDPRLETLFNDLEVLGQLFFERVEDAQIPQQIKASSFSEQKRKMPTHLKDITVTSLSDEKFNLNGSLLLSNNQILITDWENMTLKLIDTDKDNVIFKLQLSDCPYDITKVKDNEVAVTLPNSWKIQFVSVSQQSLSKGREISVNRYCWGIAYNDKDQTLIIIVDSKIQILNMAGSVLKCLNYDFKGNKLFSCALYLALSPTKTEIYVTDKDKHSVTLVSINGQVKAVYKNKSLKIPRGICVHKSGLVYVVGEASNSVHQLDPDSGEFKLLLGQKDGLDSPKSISYSEMENKMYIGTNGNTVLKVFQMK